MVRQGTVLSPAPTSVQIQEGREVRPLDDLAGKTIGFLSYIRPNYGPFSEELERHLQGEHHVASTPRKDYRRLPRWSEVKEWAQTLDAAVVGVAG